ncbi:MAG: LacI family transcriptional regulator [Actinobacteria bacterium]|nr:LacI family transcriptional regulator [Actinomycetota bacterium]
MATIQDVARAAGVGVGTVSRVLNDSPLVSEQTRARVQRIIDEMGYRPSLLARALSLGRSASLVVIVPQFTRPSTVERLRGLADAVKDSDFDLVLFDVENPDQRDQRFEMATRSDRAAGLVIVSLAAPDEIVERLTMASVPVVFLDRHVEGLPSVHIDDRAGGRLATEHLLTLGHRRIAFVGDDNSQGFGFTSSDDRRSGYRLALEAAGLPFDDRYIRVGPSSREDAHRLTAALLEMGEPPTAVFAASDLQAFGVVEAARERGLSVPGDLSVMGFDDIDASVYLGLTTVSQPLFDSGRIAAEMVLSLLAGEDAPGGIELPVELVVRKTTGPAAAQIRTNPTS